MLLAGRGTDNCNEGSSGGARAHAACGNTERDHPDDGDRERRHPRVSSMCRCRGRRRRVWRDRLERAVQRKADIADVAHALLRIFAKTQAQT